MSYACDNCGKGTMKGHNVSHAKNKTIRHYRPNLHTFRVMESGKRVVRLFCTRCLRRAKTAEKTRVKTPAKGLSFSLAH